MTRAFSRRQIATGAVGLGAALAAGDLVAGALTSPADAATATAIPLPGVPATDGQLYGYSATLNATQAFSPTGAQILAQAVNQSGTVTTCPSNQSTPIPGTTIVIPPSPNQPVEITAAVTVRTTSATSGFVALEAVETSNGKDTPQSFRFLRPDPGDQRDLLLDCAAGRPRAPRCHDSGADVQPQRGSDSRPAGRPQQPAGADAVGDHGEGVITGYQALLRPTPGLARQLQVEFKPRTPRTGRRAVILAHADDGAVETSGCGQWIDPVNYPCSGAIAAALAGTGFVCAAGDFGGTQNFGADPCALDIYTTWQSLVSNYGAANDKVVIIATSMGFCSAFQFARKYPGKVAAIAGITPAVSLTDIYVNNRVGLRSAVGVAWKVAFPATLPTVSDPTLNPGVFATTAVKLYYSTADTAVIPATVTAFAALTGAATEVISTSLPHGDAAIGATPLPDLAQFLAANGA